MFTPTGLSGTSINGTFTFYLDDNVPITTLTGVTLDNCGDSLNRASFAAPGATSLPARP